LYIEFWNVGKLGGEQYAKATMNVVHTEPAEGEEQIEPRVWEGYFTGGPNGDIYLTITVNGQSSDIQGKVKDGKEVAGVGATVSIANPEAFEGWVD
jgi:hypothetical protein